MTFIYIILGLTLIIFVHELGHFLAARWAGVKVITFSIGIGPKLLRVFKDEQGTEYIISAIPLGGYVRMKGQEDIPTQEKQDKVIEEDHYLAKPPGKRMVIILAGVVMNFILAYFLILVAYQIGIPFLNNQVGNVVPNSPAEKVGIKYGDEIIQVGNTKIVSFEDIVSEVALSAPSEPLPIKVLRDNQEKEFLIPPKENGRNQSNPNNPQAPPFRQIGISPLQIPSAANLEKTSEVYQKGLREKSIIKTVALENGETRKTINGIATLIRNNPGENVSLTFLNEQGNTKTIYNIPIETRERKEMGFSFLAKLKVIDGYPASKAGLKDGDIILEIENKRINGWRGIINAFSQSPALNLALSQSPALSLKDHANLANPGSGDKLSVPILVKRGEEEILFDVNPIYDAGNERFFIGISPLSENNAQEIGYVSSSMENQVPGIRVGDKLVSLNKNNDSFDVRLIRNGNEVNFSYNDKNFANQKEGYLFDLKDRGKIVQYGFGESLVQAIPLAYQDFKHSLVFLKRLFTQDVPLEVLGGPIAIFETSYTIHQVKGWAYFILLFAKISISIAILNLLPIPALDGGHAVFTLYEIIRKKPVPENIQRNLHLLGFLLLVFLMVYVNYNDIVRIINR